MRQHLVEMAGGPGAMRAVIQPAIAIALGILHGLRDYYARQPPFLLSLARAKNFRRRDLVTEGIREILVPLCLAVLLSLIFQSVIRSRASLIYALAFAVIFVAIPYFVSRALTNRIARAWRPPSHATRA